MIPAKCLCGQQFEAELELAGKKIKCPSCGGVIAIPLPQRPADVSDAIQPSPPAQRRPAQGQQPSQRQRQQPAQRQPAQRQTKSQPTNQQGQPRQPQRPQRTLQQQREALAQRRGQAATANQQRAAQQRAAQQQQQQAPNQGLGLEELTGHPDQANMGDDPLGGNYYEAPKEPVAVKQPMNSTTKLMLIIGGVIVVMGLFSVLACGIGLYVLMDDPTQQNPVADASGSDPNDFGAGNFPPNGSNPNSNFGSPSTSNFGSSSNTTTGNSRNNGQSSDPFGANGNTDPFKSSQGTGTGPSSNRGGFGSNNNGTSGTGPDNSGSTPSSSTNSPPPGDFGSAAPEKTDEDTSTGTEDTSNKYDSLLTMTDATVKWHAASNSKLRGVAPAKESQVLEVDQFSWMCELLPHIGHQELYDKFDFKELWFRGPNQPLCRTKIAQFVNPKFERFTWKSQDRLLGLGLTHFAGMSGVEEKRNDCAAKYSRDDPRAGIFGYEKVASADDIKDGLSNTIMIVGTGVHASPWALGGGGTIRGSRDPLFGDYGIGTAGLAQKGVIVAMADGSVREIRADIDKELFDSMCTINGGEQVDNLDSVAPKREDWFDPELAREFDKD